MVRSALHAVTQVRSVEFGHRSVHRFGKPLLMQVSSNRHLSRAGVSRSALLLLRFLSLAAGTQSRTDDNALRPALHEAGSCVSFEIQTPRQTFASFVRVIILWPCRLDGRPPVRRLRAVLSGCRDARVDRVHDLAGALRHLLRLLLIVQAGWPWAGYALAAFGGSLRQIFQAGVLARAAAII